MKAWIGYAAGAAGTGVAYARLRESGRDQIARCRFRVLRRAGFEEREVGYAALAAMLPILRRRTPKISVEIDDAEVVADLAQRREVPVALMLPSIRARCALNTFESWRLTAGDGARDLTARAAAEVTLSAAA